ncbi:MAG: serine hydrolase domain-containing protein [Intrasporangium sp.]|uniref:serine hydrolase domain-containing protein n=1 Tax=Intrasporangium sp. TaxID=1925024 RepID=UPI003F7D0A50
MSGRRRWTRRVLLGVVALILVSVGGGYWYVRPLLLTGTGYAAHNDCAVRGIAGRNDPEADLPPNPLVPYLRTMSAMDGSNVTSTVLGFFAGQTAYYSASGCTLGAPSAFAFPESQQAVSSTPNPFASGASPTLTPELDRLLSAAFGDDLPETRRATLGTRAVVVVHDGRIIAERYAPGFTATTPQLGWSMAKSVTNLLLGRLVEQATIRVTDDHLRPEWTDGRAAITVDQLERMTSGLEWNEDYDLGTTITQMLYLESDMGGYAASQPLGRDPGTHQQYSSGSTNILCSVLKDRTGLGPQLARQQLFEPLGLSSAVWETDQSGTPVCSSYLWATPRDWAAIGQFALQDGAWQGRRLLPEGWMQRSTTALPVQSSEEQGYAAGWWANRQADGTLVDPDLPADTYSARGHDGQRLVVVPSAKLVVVRLGFSPKITEPADLRVDDLVKGLVAQLPPPTPGQ